MRKMSLLLIVVMVVLTSCATPTPTEAPLPPATVTRVSTPTPLPPPPPTSFPTSLPTTEPTLPPLYPVLEKLCPANPLVPLGKLGLDPRVRLLVIPDTLETLWDENRVGVFVIAPNDPTPRRMDYFFQEGYLNSSGVSVSPDGHWLNFDRKAIGQESLVTWISSLDGQQQWPLSSPEENLSAAWLDESSVTLWDAENTLRKVINPFTMEEEILTNLPKSEIFGIGAILFRDAGQTWMLYQAGYDYRLFNVSTQTDQRVLEWLSAADVPFLSKGIEVINDGQIIIEVDRPYGLDLSPPMSVAEVIASPSYTRTMRPIILPEEVLPALPSLLSRNGSGMIVYKENLEEPGQGIPRVYWLDYQHEVIKEFCFDPADTFANISPDGRFVAFTRLYLPSRQPIPKSIFILNLETGHIAQIDGYQFLGWGRVVC